MSLTIANQLAEQAPGNGLLQMPVDKKNVFTMPAPRRACAFFEPRSIIPSQ
jgi:hypothetical protein